VLPISQNPHSGRSMIVKNNKLYLHDASLPNSGGEFEF
jgi:hypothetical protein